MMTAESAEPVINIRGKKVGLGPMARSQISTYHRWLNNFETLRSQGEPPRMPDTLVGVERWFESYVAGRDDVAWFTIYDLEDGKPVGWTELKDIDHYHGTAEFAIMIGDPDARGTGIGSEVTRLMLEYGFNTLGLFNIHLYYMAFNDVARRVYERAGFTEYGRRRLAHRSGRERFDVVFMECLADDFSPEQSGD